MSDNKEYISHTLMEPTVAVFPALFEARPFKDPKTGKTRPGSEKFGLTLVFPADSADLKTMKQLAVKAARAHPDWGGDALDTKTVRWPFKLGDAIADERKAKSGVDDGAYARGMVCVKAQSKIQPRLAGLENNQIVEYNDDAKRATVKGKFYSGVRVLAEVTFAAYDIDGKRTVTVYLNQVLTTNKGDPVAGGRKSAAETFKAYAGKASTEDPTAGMDDDIAF